MVENGLAPSNQQMVPPVPQRTVASLLGIWVGSPPGCATARPAWGTRALHPHPPLPWQSHSLLTVCPCSEAKLPSPEASQAASPEPRAALHACPGAEGGLDIQRPRRLQWG